MVYDGYVNCGALNLRHQRCDRLIPFLNNLWTESLNNLEHFYIFIWRCSTYRFSFAIFIQFGLALKMWSSKVKPIFNMPTTQGWIMGRFRMARFSLETWVTSNAFLGKPLELCTKLIKFLGNSIIWVLRWIDSKIYQVKLIWFKWSWIVCLREVMLERSLLEGSYHPPPLDRPVMKNARLGQS